MAVGVTSDELARRVEKTIRACRERVTGVGREQYEQADGSQRFELMTPLEVVRWAREEAQDLNVYATMLDVRLQQIEEALS